MTALVVSALVAALLGSGHCAAMCGAFGYAAVDVAPGLLSRARASVAYHGTRGTVYVALGLLAGTVGAGVDAAAALRSAVRPAAIVGGLLLVLWGAGRLAGLAGVRVPRLRPPSVVRRLAAGALRRAATWPPLARAALIGGSAFLLPCGWLYAFVATAASTGSPMGGAAVMAGFWIGTVPALAIVSHGLHGAIGPARRFVPIATAVALMAVGSMTLMHGLRGDAVRSHAHAHPAPVP